MWIKAKTLKSIVQRIDKLESSHTLVDKEIFILINPPKFKSGDKIKFQDVTKHGVAVFIVGLISPVRDRMSNYGEPFWTWQYELTDTKTGVQQKRLSYDLHYGPIERLFIKTR